MFQKQIKTCVCVSFDTDKDCDRLVLGRMSHDKQNHNSLYYSQNLVMSHNGGSTPRRTDWLSVVKWFWLTLDEHLASSTWRHAHIVRGAKHI